MELAPYFPQVQQVIEADEDKRQAALTVSAIQEIWPRLAQYDDILNAAKAALVYSLAETDVELGNGQVVKKWEATSMVCDEGGQPLYAQSWDEFCFGHLGIHPSTASNYRRTWEVYHRKMGYGLEEVARAGVFKLSAARATVDRQLPEPDERILEALFGNEHKCGQCGEYVADPEEECPHCSEDYRGVQPATGAETLLLLQSLRGEEKDEQEFIVEGAVEADFDDSHMTSMRVLVSVRLGEEMYHLPSWEIPVGDMVEGMSEPLLKWLRRVFA